MFSKRVVKDGALSEVMATLRPPQEEDASIATRVIRRLRQHLRMRRLADLQKMALTTVVSPVRFGLSTKALPTARD